ncbi:hypothetical protein [Sinorhizobium meliloti]|uniref:hypothetical protein n=1 Tax=Rhizobium meliloti TaxID=382 RepID=UPI0013E2E1F2|nr:hypothetical protein [Sinorhizobium meliloti]
MGYRDYFEFSAANMARIEELRLYREALNLEPSVGPWGFKVKATYIPNHLGVPRGLH